MKNLTDFRKTVETSVDPRLFTLSLFFEITATQTKTQRKIAAYQWEQ